VYLRVELYNPSYEVRYNCTVDMNHVLDNTIGCITSPGQYSACVLLLPHAYSYCILARTLLLVISWTFISHSNASAPINNGHPLARLIGFMRSFACRHISWSESKRKVNVSYLCRCWRCDADGSRLVLHPLLPDSCHMPSPPIALGIGAA
jgi:hypothetical protein